MSWPGRFIGALALPIPAPLNLRRARRPPRVVSDALIHARGRAPGSLRTARDAEMWGARVTCIALCIYCLAAAPLTTRAASPPASKTATFVEKQGHMLLLNGAQPAVQRGHCRTQVRVQSASQ